MASSLFNNVAGGTWNLAANWDPTSLPDQNSQVTFVSGSYTSLVQGGPWTIQSLNVNVSTVTLQVEVDLTAQTLEGNLGSISVQSGATLTLASLNSSTGSITVSDNGVLTVQNLNGNNGSIVAATNGLVNLQGNGAGNFTVSGGTLKIAGNFNGSGVITMDTGTMWLAGQLGGSSYDLDDGGVDHVFFDSLQAETNNIFSGADLGDRLSIKGVVINSRTYEGTVLTLNTTGGTFKFNNISLAEGLIADSVIGTTTFQGESYGFIELACFAEGTRIDTPEGPLAVEQLRAGTMVLTADGRQRPVRWIGWRSLDLRRHPHPAAAQPIRIVTDAFAPGIPRRDLLVSPGHALWVNGMLIPAEMLVNGGTIRRENTCLSVTYYHVELENHDLLLAEGLAAESYLDTGNRSMFENAELPLMLHPDLGLNADRVRRETDSCAPFVVDPAQVYPEWKRLAEVAEGLGFVLPDQATTDDPGLYLEMNGRHLKPIPQGPGWCTLVLPNTVGSVRLISHANAPSDLQPWLGDSRHLGVAVRRLTLRRGQDVTPIPVDHPKLTTGWWLTEGDARTQWRWTDGAAELVLEEPGGPALLDVEFRAMPAYCAPKAAVVHPLPARQRVAA